MAEGNQPVIWSPEALADLNGIWDYYEYVAGRNTAEKIIREIGEAVTLLEDHPFGGRPRLITEALVESGGRHQRAWRTR